MAAIMTPPAQPGALAQLSARDRAQAGQIPGTETVLFSDTWAQLDRAEQPEAGKARVDPSADAPETDAPDSDMPGMDVSDLDAPDPDIPDADFPAGDAAKAQEAEDGVVPPPDEAAPPAVARSGRGADFAPGSGREMAQQVASPAAGPPPHPGDRPSPATGQPGAAKAQARQPHVPPPVPQPPAGGASGMQPGAQPASTPEHEGRAPAPFALGRAGTGPDVPGGPTPREAIRPAALPATPGAAERPGAREGGIATALPASRGEGQAARGAQVLTGWAMAEAGPPPGPSAAAPPASQASAAAATGASLSRDGAGQPPATASAQPTAAPAPALQSPQPHSAPVPDRRDAEMRRAPPSPGQPPRSGPAGHPDPVRVRTPQGAANTPVAPPPPSPAEPITDRATLSEPALADLAPREGRLSAPAAPPATAHASADLPRQIARQIAASAADPQRATEVRLSPEELGRVRMTMLQSEHAITVTITADRADTLDLMRRNIGLLAEEFRQIGYTDIRFDFGSGTGTGGRGDRAAPEGGSLGPDTGTANGTDQETHAARPPARRPDGSIDIRL